MTATLQLNRPVVSTTETVTATAARLELALNLAPAPTAASIALTSRGWRSTFKQTFLQKLKQVAPWLISGTILGINLLVHAPLFVIGASIAGLTAKVLQLVIRQSPFLQRCVDSLFNRLGMKGKNKPSILAAAFAGGAWLSAAMPSHALFFQEAENAVRTLFTNASAGGTAATSAATQFVPLIFGGLRVIFVLYVGIALIRVISAFRNDEDWQTAARIPLITVLCIVIGDALASMILV